MHRLGIAVFLAAILAGGPLRSQPAYLGIDMSCGPRCVRYLSRIYGKPSCDFYELCKEMMGGNQRSGAAFNAISDALENRGISTCAIRLSKKSRLVWHSPAILHLNAPKRVDGEEHHFVICLPSSTLFDAHIWTEDPYPRIYSMSWSQLNLLRTEYVMLTSSSPIMNAQINEAGGRPYDSIARTACSPWLTALLVSLFSLLLFGRVLRNTVNT